MQCMQPQGLYEVGEHNDDVWIHLLLELLPYLCLLEAGCQGHSGPSGRLHTRGLTKPNITRIVRLDIPE